MRLRLLFRGIGGLALCAALAACTGEHRSAASQAAVDPQHWELSSQERAWVDAHRSGLRIASAELAGTFESTPEGEKGFHAALGRALGEFLHLPVVFHVVPFNSFFSHNGEVPEALKTDPTVRYVPDALVDSDLIAFNLTDLPWRRQLMDFVPLFRSRVVLISPRGHEIWQLSDLANKRIMVIANTSHETILRRMKAQLGLNFELVTLPLEADLFQALREGKADALVRDGFSGMVLLQQNRDFVVTLPLTSSEWLQWGVPKESPVLRSLLAKFFLMMKETGRFAEIWEKEYGLTFDDFETLVGDDPPLEWTDEEKLTLEQLRRDGLRVAINQESSIYEPQPGSARGITYNLLLEVAKRLEVPLRLRPVVFHEYFDYQGRFPEQVRTDPSFTYQPDLLRHVDLYADTLSPIDWRRRFLSFVSLYPSRLVWITRKEGAHVPGPGSRVALTENSSYEDWFRSRNLGASLTTTKSSTDALKRLLAGQADATLSDANLALSGIAAHPELTFLPADGETQDLAWAVARDNSRLKAVLDKVLGAIRHSGAFASVWRNYYHVTFDEYLSLLSTDKTP